MRGKEPILITERSRHQAIASIRRWFTENTDEEIGDLKAAIGPTIYNQAMADARAFMEERAADLEGIGYQAEFPFWKPTKPLR